MKRDDYLVSHDGMNLDGTDDTDQNGKPIPYPKGSANNIVKLPDGVADDAEEGDPISGQFSGVIEVKKDGSKCIFVQSINGESTVVNHEEDGDTIYSTTAKKLPSASDALDKYVKDQKDIADTQ